MRRALLIASDTFDDPRLKPLGAPLGDAQELRRILEDPRLGGFDEVSLLHNETSSAVIEQLERFLVERCEPSDLGLIYLTGHGVLDHQDRLCFAAPNTDTNRLLSTSIPATLIHQMLDAGPRQQLIVLDCCFSGAFASGMIAKGDQLALGDRLGTERAGRGRTILTATSRVEYALEDDAADEPTSVYTATLTNGIRSGVADLDGDGLIDADELHDYVEEALRAAGFAQRPHRWAVGAHGRLIVAGAGTPVEGPAGRARVPTARPSRQPPAASRPGRRRPVSLALLAAVVIGVVAVVVVLVVRDGPSGDADASSVTTGEPRDAGSTAPEVGTYLATVSGSAAGGRQFERQGALRIRPGDGDDPFVACLEIGHPLAPVDIGDIWFGTRGSCFGAGGEGAAATLEPAGAAWEIEPDPDFEWADDVALNAFSFTTSITGCPFVPDAGSMRIAVNGLRLDGTLNLRGLTPAGCASASSTYTATLSAAQVSDDPSAIISNPAGGPTPTVGEVTDGVTRFAVQEMLSFEQIVGEPAWVESARARALAATLVIDTEQQTFTYDAPGARDDIYPLEGTVTGTGGLLVLSGDAESTLGPTSVTLGGTVDRTGDPSTLDITISTTSAGTSSEYRAVMTLAER